MKQQIALLITVILVAVNGSSIGSYYNDAQEERVNGENGWYVPMKEGGFEWISMKEYEADKNVVPNKQGRLFSKTVDFRLFTRANPDEPQMITYESVQWSHFNPNNPTRFIIHGWKQDDKDEMNEVITKAWLEREDCNMIVVRWARAHSTYMLAVNSVQDAGEKIAKMIDYLHEHFNLNLKTLELVGHSLGSHVAGQTAKAIKSGKVYKIVGLDPAMPLFSIRNRENRLCDDDATYVEIIHTNGGKLGFVHPLGKADFYVNGGKTQPGCIFDLTGKCSHQRSITYYAEAVLKNNYPAVPCPNYDDAVEKNCGSTYSSTKMCAETNHLAANGVFYVPVNKKEPFGLGEVDNGDD